MQPTENFGHVIFLNGTSSSGKSSIAVDLRALLDKPYVHLSVDGFEAAMNAWYGVVLDSTEYDRLPHRNMLFGFHNSIAAFASASINLIVDHVIQEPGWGEELSYVLSGHDVTLVGVHAPLEVLEQREKSRPDRKKGTAAYQFGKVHNSKIYDLEVDTSIHTPIECATQIQEYLRKRHTLEQRVPTFQKFNSQ